MEQPQLNDHNKQEYPPMHTIEHLLNQTMVRMFSCGRSINAHIERKKSKCDYLLSQQPTQEQVKEIEDRVNDVISQNLPVSIELMSKQQAAKIVDISKLPHDASQTLRIVRIGDYDICACIGTHVENTSQIRGKFKIISHDYEGGRWRVRFKIEDK